MDMKRMMGGRPRIAVIDPNTLAVLGLKNILQNVLPIMEVETFFFFLMISIQLIQIRSFIILLHKLLSWRTEYSLLSVGRKQFY